MTHFMLEGDMGHSYGFEGNKNKKTQGTSSIFPRLDGPRVWGKKSEAD